MLDLGNRSRRPAAKKWTGEEVAGLVHVGALGGTFGLQNDLVVLSEVAGEVLDVAQELLVAGVGPYARDVKDAIGPIVEAGQARERGRSAKVREFVLLAADEREDLELVAFMACNDVWLATRSFDDLIVHVEAADGRLHVQHVGEDGCADVLSLKVLAVMQSSKDKMI